MPKIFISYRRADSGKDVGRIYDRLTPTFGAENVFRDIDRIRKGADFRKVLHDAVAESDVMLVIIGKQWVNIRDGSGRRRLDNPADFVRIEVENGLNSGCTVIPVLLEGTTMPNPNELPRSMQELPFRNASQVRDDPDFHRDMERLIRDIRSAPPKVRPVHRAAAAPQPQAPVRQQPRKPAQPSVFKPDGSYDLKELYRQSAERAKTLKVATEEELKELRRKAIASSATFTLTALVLAMAVTIPLASFADGRIASRQTFWVTLLFFTLACELWFGFATGMSVVMGGLEDSKFPPNSKYKKQFNRITMLPPITAGLFVIAYWAIRTYPF